MGDVAGHQPEDRADAGENLGVAADHDAERAVDRRLARARHRRVGEGNAFASECRVQLARQRRRRGAGIDHALALRQLSQQAVFAEADLAHLLAIGQRQQDGMRLGAHIAG